MSKANIKKRRTTRTIQRSDTSVGGMDVHGQFDAGKLDILPEIIE